MLTKGNVNRALRTCVQALLILSLVLGANQEHYLFETLDITDGLSQNSIMTMSTDKYGFIWFGTEDGLDRFDGLEFKHFRYNPLDPHSLNSSSILSSLVDSRGDLWIGTYVSGINKYLYETESFQRFELTPGDSARAGKGSVYDLLEDHLGYIWIATGETGLYRMDPRTSEITSLDSLLAPGDTLSDYVVLNLFEDHAGQLWIATAYGLNCLDLDNYAIINYLSYEKNPSSLAGNYVNQVYETQDEAGHFSIWAATSEGGFDRFEPNTGTFAHYGFKSKKNPDFPDTDVLSLLQVSTDRFWVGTDSKGILVMDMQGNIVDNIVRKTYDEISLKDDIIQSLYDDGNIVWVGTLGGGASKYARYRKLFYSLLYDPLNPKGLHDNRILRIRAMRDGKLWIATWSKGLTLFDPSDQSFHPYLHDDKDQSSLSTDDLQDILVDRHDNLWITSEKLFLEVLRAGSDAFERILGTADTTNGLMSDYLVSLYEDRAGYIWIGTWAEGLVRLDPLTMEFTTYTEPQINDISLGSITPYSIFEDSRGMLWLGAENEGLVGFDRENNTLIQYKAAPGDPHTLSNNDVMFIHEDQDSILWLGTYGGGLNRFDPKKRTFTNFGRKSGMLSDVIYSIYEDQDSSLWMSTNNGISRFDKITHSFQNYGIPDGVLSKEFNPAGYQDARGRIYFGGVKGITYFDPATIQNNKHIPEVHFTALSILNRPVNIGEAIGDRIVLPHSMIQNPPIRLAPEDILFSVQFISLDYAHPASNQYAYRLDGFDEEWRNIGNQRSVTFTSLPPGHYTLQVRGSNNDGLWNEKSEDLKIRVLPAFYETLAFKIGFIIILVGLIVAVYRLRTAFLRERGVELENHNIKLNAEIESRREAHRTARERANYFRAVISQSPVPMAIHNLDGNITLVNSGWVGLWEAHSAEDIIRDYQVETDPLAIKLGLGEKFKQALTGQVIEQTDLIYEDAQGKTRVVHLLLYPLRSESGYTNQVMVSIDEITEVYQQRQLLEKSLTEKELLLKEVHHRVKNNLQIIASLLGLQKAGIKDAHTSMVLDEFRSRVNSMALVHDALYRSPEFDEIDISSYLYGLLGDLRSAFEEDQSLIKINSKIPSLSLPVDIAVPCGLVINEIVTNALKYAFVDTDIEDPSILVSFTEIKDNWLRLEIKDNGKGFQKPVVWDSVESLGLYLVKILSEQQLMGRVDLKNDGGAHYIIEFPLHPDYNQ